MRWSKADPKEGTKMVVRRFLYFPTLVDRESGETRWCEWLGYEYRWSDYHSGEGYGCIPRGWHFTRFVEAL